MQKVLESGALLDLSICSFAEGNRLMKAVAKEIKNTQISLGAKGQMGDFLKLQVGDDALNTIKNLVTGLLASDEIEAALWPCIERGTYDGVHIKKDIFEDEKVRADYIPILKEALVYNLSPFFKSLKSLVKDIPLVNTGTLK
jgi:hypothetical protein